jgi:hypothetical protein
MEMNELPRWLDDLARSWPDRSRGEHAGLAHRMAGREELSSVMASVVLDLVKDRMARPGGSM